MDKRKITQMYVFLHVNRNCQKENKDPRKPLGAKVYIPFYTQKNDKLWGCDKGA